MNPKKKELEQLRSQLETERASFLSHWKQLGEMFLPRRPRFDVHDVNRGEKRHNAIYDSTPLFAVRTLASGLMAGVTSPARPWFRLTFDDPELLDDDEIKDWLGEVTRRMSAIFLRSNLYQQLPILYSDLGVFGTAALVVEEDFERVVRFNTLPIGSYCISTDEHGIVNTVTRHFQMKVKQIVEKFGRRDDGSIDWTNISTHTKNMWENNQKESWVQVVHIIRPNPNWNPKRLESKYKKYESVYYELHEDKILSEKGFDFFPVLCPRWAVTGEDSYGTDCPGMTALGDARALQLLQRRKGNAIDKMVNPPMIAPIQLRSSRISHLPGDISFLAEREGERGLRPMYEVNFNIAPVLNDIDQHHARIRRAFFEDLFLMISSDERNIPPTAEEIIERRTEKMIAIGSVLEQLNQDVLDPLIDITFLFMERRGLIPIPPQKIQGREMKVEYISIMSQAQKLIGASSIERFIRFSLSLAQTDPSVIDKIDFDNLIEFYGDAVGMNPKLIRNDEEVAQIRQARAEAKQQEINQAMAPQMVASAAKAMKDVSQVDPENPMIRDLMTQAQAMNPEVMAES